MIKCQGLGYRNEYNDEYSNKIGNLGCNRYITREYNICIVKFVS